MITGYSLPAGWTWTRLGEITTYVTSGSRDWSRYYADSGALFIRTEDINTNRLDLTSAAKVQLPEKVEGKRTLVRPGDLLITITGANVGRCATVPDTVPEAYVSQSLALVRLRDPGLAPYIHLLAQASFRGRKTELEHMAYGIGRPVLNLDNIRALPLLLAPKAEQGRIVDEVKLQFSRLDEANVLLDRVQRNMKRYRASVLKAAVEGRLVPTEAELARSEKRNYEPASMLLKRILVERRRRWEAEGEHGKYEEPKAPDTKELPELPKGWCWATVDQLSTDVRYGSSAKCGEDPDGGVPVIRMGNIVDGELRTDSLKYLPAEHDEFPELLLQPGDLLFNRTNSAELVGKSAVYRGQLSPASFASYLIRSRFIGDGLSNYVAAFLNSPNGRQWVAEVVTQQVGQANVNGTKLRACAIPLPPFFERARILWELERLFSNIATGLDAAERNGMRVARLRQSILKWAFEGKLVNQDPKDEPAIALLARIRAEKSVTPLKTSAVPRRISKRKS